MISHSFPNWKQTAETREALAATVRDILPSVDFEVEIVPRGRGPVSYNVDSPEYFRVHVADEHPEGFVNELAHEYVHVISRCSHSEWLMEVVCESVAFYCLFAAQDSLRKSGHNTVADRLAGGFAASQVLVPSNVSDFVKTNLDDFTKLSLNQTRNRIRPLAAWYCNHIIRFSGGLSALTLLPKVSAEKDPGKFIPMWLGSSSSLKEREMIIGLAPPFGIGFNNWGLKDGKPLY